MIKIIVDGFKNGKNILKNNKQDILDEIDYALSNDPRTKRLIITPWYLWDAGVKYKYKTDAIITVGMHEGFTMNSKVERFTIEDLMKV